MARDLENDVRSTHPNLLQDGEDVVGVFGAIRSDSGLAFLARSVKGGGGVRGGAIEGTAATVPGKTKFVMVTSDRMIFFAGRMAMGGGAPTDVLLEMGMEAAEKIEFLKKGDYVAISFTDGSTATLMTNASKQLRAFARAYTGEKKPY